jgi:hypothetical protein
LDNTTKPVAEEQAPKEETLHVEFQLDVDTNKVPRNYSHPELCNWVEQHIQALLLNYGPAAFGGIMSMKVK